MPIAFLISACASVPTVTQPCDILRTVTKDADFAQTIVNAGHIVQAREIVAIQRDYERYRCGNND